MTRLPPEEDVIGKIRKAGSQYHRLVLVVGVAGTGKTATLMTVAGCIDAPLVNVNLELSRRMLDLVERQRPLQVRRLLDRIVAERGSGVVLLDNIEILFDAALRQHPLRLLQDLSRSRVVAAAWNGSVEGDHVRTRPSRVPPLSVGQRSGRGCRSGGMIGAGPGPGTGPPKTAWPESNAGCGPGLGASREDAGGTSTFVIP